MVFRSNLIVGFIVVSLGISLSSVGRADEVAERHFTLKVLPLLKDKCLGCHGGEPDDVKGDFSVLSRKELIQGGESEEPGIVAGKPDEGTLMEAIAWDGLEMPPKENDRLNEKQIAVFHDWIKQGAPWPSEEAQQRYREEEAKNTVNEEGIILSTSGGTSAEWTSRRYKPEDIWAFQSVRPAETLLPSEIGDGEAIDFFITRRLKESQLTPSAPATARDLIRRATYDLTGFPPTPEELQEFEKACKADLDAAYAALIDRLLASPRYGEHWGRHWLDVTRYADTGGMSNDFERSNMWRYRDYVIRSFNQDKPYDQFVVEQLAGDELADQSFKQRKEATQEQVHRAQMNGNYNQQEAEWIVATGFLRMGPWDNAMVETDEARQMYLDDLVNITGQTFLAQTLRCCKCHDHKFDPIPTRDYYRFYSALATTQMAERKVPLLEQESREGFEEGKAHVQRMLDFAVREKTQLVEKREAAARKWFEEHGLPYKNDKARQNLPDEEKPPRHVGLDYAEQGRLKVREQDEWIWNRRLERYQPMAQSVYNSETTHLAWNGARKLRIHRKGKAKPLKNFILLGGALTALGDPVLPGVLSAVTLPVSADPEHPYLLPAAADAAVGVGPLDRRRRQSTDDSRHCQSCMAVSLWCWSGGQSQQLWRQGW